MRFLPPITTKFCSDSPSLFSQKPHESHLSGFFSITRVLEIHILRNLLPLALIRCYLILMSTATPSSAATAMVNADQKHQAEEPPSDSSKLKTFLSIIKNFIGVSDLAAVRFSLPAQLLEPTPNLEYWNYLDSPNAFIAIGTSDEPLDRMLEVVRFWFTKDLKYAKGKPCKPYNSCLGEFFRCNWEAEDNAPTISTSGLTGGIHSSLKVPNGDPRTASTVSVPKQTYNGEHKTVRISYLTEQTSHHPPVSAFHISCPERGLSANGFDQITAKFTGTSVKVIPGEHNLGIFITLEKRNNETYQLTHPAAHLGGILRGALNVTVGEQCYITCKETKIKCILHYSDQGWTRSINIVEGVVFKYDPENDNKIRIKDVPDSDVLARLHGPWKEKVVFTVGPKPVVCTILKKSALTVSSV